MSEKDFWSLAEGEFPSIEIDVEYFKTLSKTDRIKYIVKLLFQEKDLGSRMQLLNYIVGTISKLGNVFIKNKEIKEIIKLLESATRLVGVSAALGNIVKAKQTYRHTKNNEIAKLMGFPNGNYVDVINIDVTQAMLEAFLEMGDRYKDKYKVVIDQTTAASEDGAQKKGNGSKDEKEEVVGFNKVMIAGHIEKDENKFGIIMNTVVNKLEEDSDTTYVAHAKLFYPVTGSEYTNEVLKDKLERIMYELYLEKVDTRQNYVVVNGSRLEIMPRHQVTENIKNIDIENLRKVIEKTLREKTRRGIVLVGEPGVGKTIAVHKLVNYFPDRLVFMVKPDSISSTYGIRNTFRLFEMFESSIMVFDDIDSAPLTKKDEVTNEFLVKLDGTSKLTGFIIATVNDPSKLHPALINRPERFDLAIEVKTPQTTAEIYEIIMNKAKEYGYHYKDESKKPKIYGEKFKGYIIDKLDSKTNKKLSEFYKNVLAKKFTQVQIANLVRLSDSYDSEISLKSLTSAYEKTIESIKCSNMIATKGRLIESTELSEEAKANMYNGKTSHLG